MNLSRLSVNERLRRLQENGVVQGFTARISSQAIGKSTLAIIQIGNLKIARLFMLGLLNTMICLDLDIDKGR